jgi:hypothetical protein
MADKSYKVPHGSRVNLEIPVRRAASPAQSSQPQRHGALFPSDQDEDLYVFTRGVKIYDLGTRKQTDGSYAHITFDMGLPSFTESYHAALLAGDFTKGDACLRLPAAAEFLMVDMLLTKDGEQKREIIGAKDKRPLVKDIQAQAESAHAFVSESNWSKDGLKFKLDGDWFVGCEAAFFYNQFDSSDTVNFKVTDSADPTAAPTATMPKASKKSLLKIYLTPRCNFTGSFNGSASTTRMSRFLPVVPKFDLVKTNPYTQLGHEPLDEDRMEAHATASFWTAIESYYGAAYGADFIAALSWYDDALNAANLFGEGASVLVAVIVSGSKPYYVWRVGAADMVKWPQSRIINPDF